MTDARSYPYAGHPRRFVAVAMPNGDEQFGIAGPLVFLTEQRGHCQDRPKHLSLAEAQQLHAALGEALTTFARGAAMAGDDRPCAYTGDYPIRGETLADVWAVEAAQATA